MHKVDQYVYNRKFNRERLERQNLVEQQDQRSQWSQH
jgi:hypothetical protein